MNASPVVSVVIPVCNTTAEYLDECLESVVRQTYPHLDIILVDDESTDNSFELCKKWEKTEPRIRALSIKHSGVGAARNFGMCRATGDYLMFLDSDDWWDGDLVEQAVTVMESFADVDFTWFDLAVHWSNGDVVSAKRAALLAEPSSVHENHLMLTASGDSLCDRIYRMTFLIKIGFAVPHMLCEDTIINPSVFLEAKKVFSLKRVGYHYRLTPGKTRAHDNSFLTPEHPPSVEAMKVLRQKGLLESSRSIFEKWALFRCRTLENLIRYGLQNSPNYELEYTKELSRLIHKMDEVSEKWRIVEENAFLAFGSYSVRSIVNYLLLDLRRVQHFQWSSLAGAFSDKSDRSAQLVHPSGYRSKMINHELKGSFAAGIDNGHADFLILDLLEERFPLLECANSAFLTKSDALDESGATSPLPWTVKILQRGDTHTEDIWKKHCLEAIARIKKRFDPSQVVLIKTFLAEHYGEYGPEHQFDNMEAIRHSNTIIEACYSFFESNFPGIHAVSIPDALNFSDTSFKHGCFPWHLNDFCYYAITDSIRDYILSRTKGGEHA